LREALGLGEDADVVAEAGRLREALGLSEDADLVAEARRITDERRELELAEAKRQVAAFVEEQVEGLKKVKYPDAFRESFRDAVLAGEPATVEEATALIEAKRAEYDPLVAKARLEERGYKPSSGKPQNGGPLQGSGSIRPMGSLLEQDTGVPDYARLSQRFSESLARHGHGRARRWNRALDEMSQAERYAVAVLEKFDADNRTQLLAEARRFEEAETASDLGLPYTAISRTIIMEAFPELVAANIFDFGVADGPSTRIFFERFADETGVVVTIADEDVEISAPDAWVDLAHERVQTGTVIVEPNGGGTPYVEDTDYVFDYFNGCIMALSTGSMTASPTTYDVDYKYDAVRKGEMQSIERGKQQLVSKTLEAVADRMAVQISREAVVFSQAQLGYNALARAIVGVIGRVRRRIDKDIFQLALSMAKTVPNNSGGTWSATVPADRTYQEHLDVLLRYIGVAKMNLVNRYYSPTAILCSGTNGDMLGNSNKWNRPDTDVDAAGYMGRVKGLPIFAAPTEQFTDGHIMVVNRELVLHRVFIPMKLSGAHSSYDSDGKLIAAEQYYVEEFNGTDAPVPEKGSYVVIN
jgi:hypothetical protein